MHLKTKPKTVFSKHAKAYSKKRGRLEGKKEKEKAVKMRSSTNKHSICIFIFFFFFFYQYVAPITNTLVSAMFYSVSTGHPSKHQSAKYHSSNSFRSSVALSIHKSTVCSSVQHQIAHPCKHPSSGSKVMVCSSIYYLHDHPSMQASGII